MGGPCETTVCLAGERTVPIGSVGGYQYNLKQWSSGNCDPELNLKKADEPPRRQDVKEIPRRFSADWETHRVLMDLPPTVHPLALWRLGGSPTAFFGLKRWIEGNFDPAAFPIPLVNGE